MRTFDLGLKGFEILPRAIKSDGVRILDIGIESVRNVGCKDSGRHLESGVYTMMIVVMNVMVDSFDQSANGLEAIGIAELLFEAPKEGLAIAILPW